MQKVRENLNIQKEGEKLVADLEPKKNYVISAYLLKAYLRAGVKISGDWWMNRFWNRINILQNMEQYLTNLNIIFSHKKRNSFPSELIYREPDDGKSRDTKGISK